MSVRHLCQVVWPAKLWGWPKTGQRKHLRASAPSRPFGVLSESSQQREADL